MRINRVYRECNELCLVVIKNDYKQVLQLAENHIVTN